MNARFLTWIAALAIGLASTLAGLKLHGRSVSLGARLSDARRNSYQLSGLEQENRRLLAGRLTEAEREELRLKNEETARLQAQLGDLRAKMEETSPKDSRNQASTIPSGSWAYRGLGSPRSSVESVLWSASHGDIERLAGLLTFTPDVRARAEALYAHLPAASKQEYISAENVVATILAGSFPKDATTLTYQSETSGADSASVMVRVDHSSGQQRSSFLVLHNSPAGWQWMVPASIVEDCESQLGMASPAEAKGP